PKQGFVTPIAAWMRGPLANDIRAIGRSSLLIQSGWIDERSVSALADAHISGRADHSRTLWQLLMLDKSLSNIGIQG
ncbi:MAG: asparagine synthase-related protein, partial [Pseudomonadota bacterium]